LVSLKNNIVLDKTGRVNVAGGYSAPGQFDVMKIIDPTGNLIYNNK